MRLRSEIPYFFFIHSEYAFLVICAGEDLFTVLFLCSFKLCPRLQVKGPLSVNTLGFVKAYLRCILAQQVPNVLA